MNPPDDVGRGRLTRPAWPNPADVHGWQAALGSPSAETTGLSATVLEEP